VAVYTSLSATQINDFLSVNKRSAVIHYQGISAGIENSNYRINTLEGEFILTLYEHFTLKELQPYLKLLQKLGQLHHYYPAPTPLTVQQLVNKPAALFKCLSGESVTRPNNIHIKAVGVALAQLHLSSSQLDFSQTNPKGIKWMGQAALRLSPYLSSDDALLLNSEMQYQQAVVVSGLEQGGIHADLFRDNVLFTGNQLSGFLDFYAACYDTFLIDIAITLNDWCVDEQGVFDWDKSSIFIQAYQTIRLLSEAEQLALPLFLRRACLRFWLSRLEHQTRQKAGALVLEKSPEIFKQLLLQHRAVNL